MATRNKNTFTKNPATSVATLRESALFDVSRNDPDIFHFIEQGFLLIPIANFTRTYLDSVRGRDNLQSYFINTFFVTNTKDFRDSNGNITVRLFSVEFDPEMEVFRGLATLAKPYSDEFFLSVEIRNLVLDEFGIFCVEKSAQAAHAALKEMDES